MVCKVGDDEDEDFGFDYAHCQIGLGMELGIDEMREGCQPSQLVMRILPTITTSRQRMPCTQTTQNPTTKWAQLRESSDVCQVTSVWKIVSNLLDFFGKKNSKIQNKILSTI
jgi:hypothetical protein